MRFGNPELFVYIDFDIEGSGDGADRLFFLIHSENGS
jgi:hypothetical protein